MNIVITTPTFMPIGGIETYIKNLIKIFTNENHKVYLLSKDNFEYISNLETLNFKNCYFIKHKYFKETKKDKKTKILIYWEYILLIIRDIKFNHYVNKFTKKINANILINNDNSYRSIWFNPKLKKKAIWVQHIDFKSLTPKSGLIYHLRKLFFIKLKLRFQNYVVYSQLDKKYLLDNNFISKKAKMWDVNLSAFSINEMNYSHTHTHNSSKTILKDQIAFIGRFDDKQKNISFLNKITKTQDNLKIHTYGSGPDVNLIENNPNIINHNSFERNELQNIFKKVKLLLLPSNYEGFAFVIVEALSYGVPCVIANTYLDASYLINDNRGKLIDGFNPQEWARAISDIYNLPDDQYSKLANNCLNFARENLSFEIFEKKWISIIEEVNKIN